MTIEVDHSKAGKMRFIIDKGTEISIIKGTSLKPGVVMSLQRELR
jgi:hypothetical protein